MVRGWSRPAMLTGLVLTCLLAVAVVVPGCSAQLSCGGEQETTSAGVSSTSAEVVTSIVATTGPTTSTTSTTTVVTETSSTTTSTVAPSSTTESLSTTTTESLSSAETRLADGTIKAMGFIDRVWESGGTRYISIDYAEMLTGEEARQAAIEAGEIGPDEDLPNDYYIRNVNPKKRVFRVSLSVAITTSTRWAPHDGMDAPCTWEDFKSFWSGGPLPEGDRHLHLCPWWIVRDGDLVIRIDEQYLP
ncbi:MAG: hypothetical protein N3B14_03745 [Thermoleophilia bacterium]|nr:hypothetical protein [Thermoleophilia bacterium]